MSSSRIEEQAPVPNRSAADTELEVSAVHQTAFHIVLSLSGYIDMFYL